MSKEFKLSRLRIVNSLIQLRSYFTPVLKTPLCGVTISVVLSFECKLNWSLSFQLVNKQLSLLNKIWVVFAIDKKSKSNLLNAKELTSQITEVRHDSLCGLAYFSLLLTSSFQKLEEQLQLTQSLESAGVASSFSHDQQLPSRLVGQDEKNGPPIDNEMTR